MHRDPGYVVGNTCSTPASGLEAFEYAIESNPYYQLLKRHEREVLRIVFKDGEQSVVKVLHVDEQPENFVYDLVSTNTDRDYYREHRDAALVAKFVDLVSVQLCE